jgi:hypothetical protein
MPLSVVRFLALGVVFALSTQTLPLAAAQAIATKKEDFRWDGKPFSYWQSYWRTELKPERRAETMRALGAFGTRGYAEEAAVAILEILSEYDLSQGFSAAGLDPKATPEEQVLSQGAKALGEIGTPIVPRLLVSRMNDKKVCAVAHHLLYFKRLPISPSDVNALFASALAQDPEIAEVAVKILYGQSSNPVYAALESCVAKDGDGEKFLAVLVHMVTDRWDLCAMDLLNRLGPSGNSAIPLLVEAVNKLAKERQQEFEDRLESRRKVRYFVPAPPATPAPLPRPVFSLGPDPDGRKWRSVVDKANLGEEPGIGRKTTIKLLGLLANKGRAAKQALPMLRDPNLLQDPYQPLREAVADAIAKIDRPRRAP